ncbi:MAG: pilin [Rectinemataceae bacterium]|nr:pilin [Rectinemataceae bacterium]
MRYVLLLLVLITPAWAHAAKSFAAVTEDIVQLVNGSVVPLVYALAFLLFIFGMVRFFFFGGEENREKGKTFMIWGIIGFVVMFSVWGIVRLLLTALPG